jgi:hypothetical protein
MTSIATMVNKVTLQFATLILIIITTIHCSLADGHTIRWVNTENSNWFGLYN